MRVSERVCKREAWSGPTPPGHTDVAVPLPVLPFQRGAWGGGRCFAPLKETLYNADGLRTKPAPPARSSARRAAVAAAASADQIRHVTDRHRLGALRLIAPLKHGRRGPVGLVTAATRGFSRRGQLLGETQDQQLALGGGPSPHGRPR
ncbi:hypothetical protein AAFF_G00049690 [Aldrovandia affinis]|uniref:Uncharacterized protein n=1 Tax=Aldrovandia affinis TaxID=143900 RepID=A0AAD7S197_9TELE|nr:hypothetical protein AAFF_G00049690 [Aldrovandia affinis]